MANEAPVDVWCRECGTHEKCETQRRAEAELAEARMETQRIAASDDDLPTWIKRVHAWVIEAGTQRRRAEAAEAEATRLRARLGETEEACSDE